MKRIIIVLCIVFLLLGCSAEQKEAGESQWAEINGTPLYEDFSRQIYRFEDNGVVCYTAWVSGHGVAIDCIPLSEIKKY